MSGSLEWIVGESSEEEKRPELTTLVPRSTHTHNKMKKEDLNPALDPL